MTVLSLLLGILVIVAITALTAYFVAQEFAYMAVDRSRLGAAAAAGDPAAKRALAVTQRTSFMLSGAQLGITVTGLLVGYVAEPLVGQALGTMLGGVGVPTTVGVGVGTVLALALSTGVQMVFGELFPKNLAIARPEPVARWLATSTTLYLKLFGWLIWIFDQSSNLLLKALGIEPVHDVEHSATPRDLEAIVERSRDSGDLSPALSLLLDRILDFPDEAVEHAMIPRVHVDHLPPDATLAEIRIEMSGGHSRYPVIDDEDQVMGVVDLIDVMTARDERLTAADLVRPALLMPTLMMLPEAVQEFALTKQQMACVLDEYGGFAGVITIEDLAEELVGEITDEHDSDAAELQAIAAADGTWIVSGSTPVDEVERAMDRDLPEGDYETLAGLFIATHGRLPEVGTTVALDLGEDLGRLPGEDPSVRQVEMEVVELDGHVPGRIRLTLLDEDGDPYQRSSARVEEIEQSMTQPIDGQVEAALVTADDKEGGA
ncbi:hemolysin family protein [Nocardioides jishulii]|uniref:HlyC/CorC family transporter n=1 Tax=Nocardioides jishulii TaxID=2575440 RepID=A0A4U2YJN5_9ACTN|nr:hemolysin family protein [Nocardioides jishulii]QCX28230.1 HlyC/CorC family transporter [Nocardioides jishulii]TKI60894.1 HlyC/CorC family transporter [Nocardioides jishulii]